MHTNYKCIQCRWKRAQRVDLNSNIKKIPVPVRDRFPRQCTLSLMRENESHNPSVICYCIIFVVGNFVIVNYAN